MRSSAWSWIAGCGSALCVIAACGPPPRPAPMPAPSAGQPRGSATPSAIAEPTSTTASSAPPPAPKSAVLCENEDAADAGDAILAKGGSAADAAIAALVAAGVAQPASSGLGGGGLALHWDAETKRATVIDFLVTAPIGLRPKEHLRVERRPALRGRLVGVPGEAAGLHRLHQLGGKLAWGKVLEPAITLAAEGFTLSAHMHRALRWRRGFVTANAALRAAFAPMGALATRGTRLKRPALAKTLQRLAAGGARSLYESDLADELVGATTAKGGRLAHDDLERYRAIVREPLTTTWDGHQVLTVPPPSAGGLLVAETLGMHRPAQLVALERDSGALLHVLAETFRGAHDDRYRYIGDPDYLRMDLDALLDRDRLAKRRRAIAPDSTAEHPAATGTESGTTNVIVVDPSGDVVVATSSLNGLFGARLRSEGGVILNDHLATFSTDREHRLFSASRRVNVARGGARPVTSMAPTLVLRDGQPVLALAASGGSQMSTAVAQGLVSGLAFRLDAAAIARGLRIDAPPTGGLRIDPRAAPSLREDLAARGEVVDASRPLYGGLMALRWVPGVGLDGAVDPRKGGAVRLR